MVSRKPTTKICDDVRVWKWSRFAKVENEWSTSLMDCFLLVSADSRQELRHFQALERFLVVFVLQAVAGEVATEDFADAGILSEIRVRKAGLMLAKEKAKMDHILHRRLANCLLLTTQETKLGSGTADVVFGPDVLVEVHSDDHQKNVEKEIVLPSRCWQVQARQESERGSKHNFQGLMSQSFFQAQLPTPLVPLSCSKLSRAMTDDVSSFWAEEELARPSMLTTPTKTRRTFSEASLEVDSGFVLELQKGVDIGDGCSCL